ncbi:hypothetical protein ACIBTV_27780 [Micromonospora sp. NPDC049366]|uniref:hypothetical protein n=1 Tax=Micromonospora sp. NPDC049366 TaxID=3364271 RepID=UPI0037BC7987
MPSAPSDRTPPRAQFVRGAAGGLLPDDELFVPRRRSSLRDSAPDPRDVPPPEVTGALWPLPSGGPWEGGAVDRDGRHWTHRPWQGWRPARSPYLAPRGRVYQSRAVSRAFRRGRRARRLRRVVRWTTWPTLLTAAALVYAGLVHNSLPAALVGLTLAELVLLTGRWR